MSGEDSLEEVAATDAALIAVGRGQPAPSDDRLLTLLAAWRTELSVDDDAIELPFDRPLPSPARRGRPGRWLAAVAAVAVIAALGGVAAAGSARPGSPLWPVTKVVYADRATSILAEEETRHSLDRATDAIVAGDVREATRQLEEAEQSLVKVTSTDAAQKLRDQAAGLRDLTAVHSGNPGEPLPQIMASPVPSAASQDTDGQKPPDTSRPGPKPTLEPGGQRSPGPAPRPTKKHEDKD